MPSSWVSAAQHKWVIYLGHYSSTYLLLLQALQHPGFKIWEQTTQFHHIGSSISGTPSHRHASCTAQLFAALLDNSDPLTAPLSFSPYIFPLLPLSGLRKSLFFSTQTPLFTHPQSNPNLTQVIERLLWCKDLQDQKKGRQSFMQGQVKLLLNRINRQSKKKILENPELNFKLSDSLIF